MSTKKFISLLCTCVIAAVFPATAEDTLTIASWGGSYQDAQSKALFQPAAKELGIRIKEETFGGMSDVRLKVKANAVEWDIVVSGSGSAGLSITPTALAATSEVTD